MRNGMIALVLSMMTMSFQAMAGEISLPSQAHFGRSGRGNNLWTSATVTQSNLNADLIDVEMTGPYNINGNLPSTARYVFSFEKSNLENTYFLIGGTVELPVLENIIVNEYGDTRRVRGICRFAAGPSSDRPLAITFSQLSTEQIKMDMEGSYTLTGNGSRGDSQARFNCPNPGAELTASRLALFSPREVSPQHEAPRGLNITHWLGIAAESGFTVDSLEVQRVAQGVYPLYLGAPYSEAMDVIVVSNPRLNGEPYYDSAESVCQRVLMGRLPNYGNGFNRAFYYLGTPVAEQRGPSESVPQQGRRRSRNRGEQGQVQLRSQLNTVVCQRPLPRDLTITTSNQDGTGWVDLSAVYR